MKRIEGPTELLVVRLPVLALLVMPLALGTTLFAQSQLTFFTVTQVTGIGPEPSGLQQPYTVRVAVLYVGDGEAESLLTTTIGSVTVNVYGSAGSYTSCRFSLAGGVGYTAANSCSFFPDTTGVFNVTAEYSGGVSADGQVRYWGSTSTSQSHTVVGVPSASSAGFTNAASFKGGANSTGLVTPGGLYSIYGTDLGPAQYVPNGPYGADGKLATSLGGVSVTFDGVLAPMLLAYTNQLNLQVPFEVAGNTSTQVVINYLGLAGLPVAVPVGVEQPAFFTVTPLGTDSIATNHDGTLNSPQNPEARGNAVTLYGTGLGELSYSVATGGGAPIPPPGYTGNYTCTLGTMKTSAAFVGWAPTAVGLAQFNLSVPTTAPTGTVPVTCTSPAGNSTQQGTLYIK